MLPQSQPSSTLRPAQTSKTPLKRSFSIRKRSMSATRNSTFKDLSKEKIVQKNMFQDLLVQRDQSQFFVLKQFPKLKRLILNRAVRLRQLLDQLPMSQQMDFLQANTHFDILLQNKLIILMKSKLINIDFYNFNPATFRSIQQMCIRFLQRQIALQKTSLRKDRLIESVADKYKTWFSQLHNRKYEAFPE